MRSTGPILLFLLTTFAVPAAATPIEGIWRVEDGKAHVRVHRCGEHHCGTVVWLGLPLDDDGKPRTDVHNRDPELRDRLILGLQLLRGLSAEPNGRGVWTGGRIYDTETGKIYKCRMRLDDGGLLLHGYVGIKLFGKSTHWTRVPEDAPARISETEDRRNGG